MEACGECWGAELEAGLFRGLLRSFVRPRRSKQTLFGGVLVMQNIMDSLRSACRETSETCETRDDMKLVMNDVK